MAAAPQPPDPPTEAPAPRRQRRWLGYTVLTLLVALLITGWAAVRWIDTEAGHRFLIRQIAGWQPASGLRVSVGSIEGRVFKSMVLRDVRFADPKGRFGRIERADLNWYPFGWLSNRLDIDRLHIHAADLTRLPQFVPGKARGSILPGFDIRLAELRIDRLALGEAVAGKPHIMRGNGKADIRKGRAVIDLAATALDTADAIRLDLDSRPDDKRFDIDLLVAAPQGGIITGLIGTDQAMALAIRGDGDWRDWRGGLVAVHGGRPAARLALHMQEGRYKLHGPLALIGPLAGLGSGEAMIDADLRFDKRVLAGTASAALAAVQLKATGGLDLGRNRFDEVRLEAVIAQPGKLAAGVTGRPVQLRARLAGPFRNVAFDYRLTAPELRQGKLGLRDLRLAGDARLAGAAGSFPFRLTAGALAVGEAQIDERLRNLVVEGRIQRTDGQLRLAPTALRASGFAGQLDGQADPGTGRLAGNFRGGFNGLEIKGLGRLDVAAVLRLMKPAGGAMAFTGTGRATMQRLDSGFLRGLGEGLPILTSDLALAGQRVALRNLRATAPALTLAGNGFYDLSGGTLTLEGTGEHRAYGPVRLTLEGKPDRPRVDLTLANPLPALRLRDVHALLVPDDDGYAVSAEGSSMLGAFKGEGAILLPADGTATIAIAGLGVSDVTVKGDLVPVEGGLEGTLALSGPAEGKLALSMVDNSVQRIGVEIDLGDANFTGSPQLTVNRGAVRGELLLRPGAVTIKGDAQARGMRIGGLRVGRFAGAVDLVNGAGTATVSMNTGNGRQFDLQARAAIAAERIRVDMRGSVNQRAVTLDRPLVLTSETEGWRLAPVTLQMQGGALRLSGLLGATATQLTAQARALPLALLDILNSDLGLGGTADGDLTFDQPRGGQPTGRMNLRIKGLTRSGLALSSAPIDIGVNAALDSQRLAARALVARGGAVVGRWQALVAPLGAGSLADRLIHAPLRAQLRYAGDADTLWRLTNVEILSLGGDVAISANAGGTLADPQIQGTLEARNASLQSPVTGLALTGVTAHGTFNGAQLTLDDLSGRTAGNGTLRGTATFDISFERGIGMDIAMQAERAVLLDRDDVGATVTGPLRIRSSGNGGVISGNLDVVASRFMLGQAAATAEIPQLRLVELNRSGEEVERTRAAAPWRLDVKARVPSRLMVEGLGMASEWSADLAIGGLVTAPQFTGTATLIRGSYDFAGKRFDLEEGRLTFGGESPVNPVLDIRASADVHDLSATINVTGTSLRPIIAFSSIPAMPQDELLARLLFGTSIANLSAPEAIQLASAVAAFQGGGGGLDPINAVRRATGLSRLRILPADTTTGQKTSIAAGKNIGRNLYVELVTDGQGYSATSVEYQITRWLALLSSVSTIGRQSVSARVSKDY